MVLNKAIDIAASSLSDSNELDLLSLLLVLFRQLKAAIDHARRRPEAKALLEQVYRTLAPALRKLGPALRPGSSIADTITLSIESSDKTRQLRAGDVLAAACRMADSLPTPATSGSRTTSILVPLFDSFIRSGPSTRSSLVGLNIMLEHIPSSAVPISLLDDLLKDLDALDSASVRCAVIGNLLSRRRYAAGSLTDEKMDGHMLSALVPYFDSTRPATTLTTLTRYLLPVLFKSHPSSAKSLLQALGDRAKTSTSTGDVIRGKMAEGTEIFSAWVSVASLAVSQGHVDIDDLPQPALKVAMTHDDPDVRMRVFQLLAGSKDLFLGGTMDLIKESLRWNAVLPSAG